MTTNYERAFAERPEVYAAWVTRPGSVVVGPDGALYVSNQGTSIGTGEVLRIEP
jgi:glucose/arabinose dehydrogenase